MVEVEHTSETLPAHDAAARGSVVVDRCDELVAERLMGSLNVIMSSEISDELAQVTLAQRYDHAAYLSLHSRHSLAYAMSDARMYEEKRQSRARNPAPVLRQHH
jgi:hypothetical protein